MKLSLTNFFKVNGIIQNVSLRGKKYITPKDLSSNELMFILTTALEMKTSKEKLSYTQSLVGRQITFLLDAPCIRLQTCLHNTSNLLKMPLNVLISNEWENMIFPQDIGRFLSMSTDIIFCKAHRQRKLEHLAQGSTVPVVNVSSCRFLLLQNLSNLLTLRQHFGTLDDIIIAWIGHAYPLLNTYLTIAPTLKMHIKFLCQSGGPVSPSDLHKVLSQGERFVQNIKECATLSEVIEGAHVIEITDHSEKHLKLKLSDLDKYANKDWVLLHTLPRTTDEVESEVFESDRNLIWRSSRNYKWICAAIISRFLDLEEHNVNINNHSM